VASNDNSQGLKFELINKLFKEIPLSCGTE
jgi:hypothetical protein